MITFDEMKLEEGKIYNFYALKIIELPGGDANLLLRGPDGCRYLLPLDHYSGYHLHVNSEIQCKVDKINCNGKVFLEPEHPLYREGERYDFTVHSFSSSLTDLDKKGKTVILSDKAGNLINASYDLFNDLPEPDSTVTLRIERISKGKIFFHTKTEPEEIGNLEEGKTYNFTIVRVITGADDEEYFIAADSYGKEHRLRVRYYLHYGFSEGSTFRGKVMRYSAGSHRTIEPENPWYNPGDTIEVTVAGCTPLDTGEGFMTEVFDAFGFSHNILLDSKPVERIIRCRIIKMRKGRPVLRKE